MLRELPGPRWAVDPSGRHELRYWDGTTWTAHVSDAGVTDVDALGTGGAPPSGADPRTSPAPPAGLARMGPVVPVDTRFWTPAASAASGLGSATGGATTLEAAPAGADPAHPGRTAGPNGSGPDGGSATAWPMPAVLTVRWPLRPRTAFALGAGALVTVGLLAAVIGFSGLPDGRGSAALPNVVPIPSGPPDVVAEPDPVLDPPSAPDLDPPSPGPVPTTSTRPPRNSPAAIVTETVTATVTAVPGQPVPGQPVTGVPVAQPTTPPATTEPVIELLRYRSCPQLRRDHPRGVGLPGARDRRLFESARVDDFTVSRALYRLNAIFDIDLDGVTCEP